MRSLRKAKGTIALLLGVTAVFSSCAHMPPENTEVEPTTPPIEYADETYIGIFPPPMEFTLGDSSNPKKIYVENDSPYKAMLEQNDLYEPFESNGLKLEINLDDNLEDEYYALSVSLEDTIKITAKNDKGVFYAITTLLQLKDNDGIKTAEIKDKPAFPIRGVIEGFYGEAYSEQFRLDLMEFMGQKKMNTYIYAPKDDKKHREKWRELYNEEELESLKKLVDKANSNYVNFVYAISPGNDINLGARYEEDFEKLVTKCQQMYDIGVRSFSVLLDDILTHDAEGHAKLLNDFRDKFVKPHEGTQNLIAITTEYTDYMLTDYTTKLAPMIGDDIELMWTGPGVIPESITNASLKKIVKTYGRKVLIWWNYPVNDLQQDYIFPDAARQLEETLNESITGLVSNPMNQGYISLIPLSTTADYLWNPKAYDADKSLVKAVRYIDPSLSKELLSFVDTAGASPMNGWTSNNALKNLLKEFSYDKLNRDYLLKIIDECTKIADIGKLRDSSNKEFVKEALPWINRSEAYGRMAIAYFEMEYAYLNDDISEIIKQCGIFEKYRALANELSAVVSKGTLDTFLANVSSRVNYISGVADAVTFLPAKAFTNMPNYKDYAIDRIADGDDGSYFWSDGAPANLGGKNAYVGVELSKTSLLENIYIATGENGGDVFANAIIEISTDNKTWTEIAEGPFKAEIYIKNIGKNAKYVRMRNTDLSSSSWIKVRTFEVNTTRTIEDDIGKFKVSTNMPTYQDFIVENVADKNSKTFFWAGRNVNAGDYVMIDLGSISKISEILIDTGVNGHTADSMTGARLEVSEDGVVWKQISAVTQGRKKYDSLNEEARFIRLIATKATSNWFTMSDFEITYEESKNDVIFASDEIASPSALMKLLDKNVLTGITINAPGEEISINISGQTTARILAPNPGSGSKLILKDGSDKILNETLIDNPETIVNIKNAQKMIIVIGNGEVTISEIVLN